MQELVRYIHLNLLRAKIVVDLEELDRYSYCGHRALIGKKKRQWQDVEYVLGFFGRRVGEAKKVYVSYVKKAFLWLAQLVTHIPNRVEQMVRYYGFYSNKS